MILEITSQMKKVLLISGSVLHYRQRIYNRFYDLFKERGYELHVLSDDFQNASIDSKFIKHDKPYGFSSYMAEINKIQPDVVICFIPSKWTWLMLFCRLKRIPVIYWGHGLNVRKAENKFLLTFYRLVHFINNALIIYTPDQLKYLTKNSAKKVFIAYNTLDFSDVDKSSLRNPTQVKELYGIKEDKVVMYISRILPYKELDVLLCILKSEPKIGLVIVGGGISPQQLNIVNTTSNFYYLGEKYGKEVDEIYSMGDVFSTPGHIGLALNQAFYWGKPVVVLNKKHAPEIHYMQDGVNGYVVHSEAELKAKIEKLCANEMLYNEMSKNATKTYVTEMAIERMFQGFIGAISYCEQKNK